MNTNNMSWAILVAVVTPLLSTCGTSTPPSPTQTSTPTSEPIQTPTPLSTITFFPINTPPPSVNAFNIILTWSEINFANDMGWQNRGDIGSAEYACANYLNPDSNALLTNCFGVNRDPGEMINLIESQGGGERLDRRNAFDQYGEYYVQGLQEQTPNRGLSFYGVLGINSHIMSTTINFPNETEQDLQKFYDERVSDLFFQVFQANLSKFDTGVEPTPPSPEQQNNFDNNSAFLTNQSELNLISPNQWDQQYDWIGKNIVCRYFAFRYALPDVYIISLQNCAINIASGYSMDQLIKDYYPSDTVLDRKTTNDGDFLIVGYREGSGHTIFEALVISNKLLFRAVLEQRTALGQEVSDLINQEIINFLYSMLTLNLEKTKH